MAEDSRSAARGAAVGQVWPVLVAALGVGALVTARLVAHGGDPSVFVLVSQAAVRGALPGGVHPVTGPGYDGQFTYALAVHPFGHTDVLGGVLLDKPAYRAQRLLLPLLTHLLAVLGLPVVAGLVLLNALALVGSTAVTARLLNQAGQPPSMALLVGLSPGLLLGLVRSTSEPLAVLLVLLALLAWTRRKPVLLATAASAAVLSRETAVVVPLVLLVLAAVDAVRRRPAAGRLLVACTVSVVVLLVWQAWLRHVWGQWAVLQGPRNLGPPLLGPLRDLLPPYRPAGAALSVVATWELERLWLLGLLLAVGAAVACGQVRRPGPAAAAVGTSAVAVCARTWQEDAGFLRVTSDAAALSVLALALAPPSWTRRGLLALGGGLSLLVALLHVANP